jgi:FKBP-type peptidyl-prolyl cis-trans isomerase 2
MRRYRLSHNRRRRIGVSLAKNGDTVTVHFTGKLEDGKIFDTSKSGKPLEFTIGSGTMMPGLEKGILGMQVGDTKTFTVEPEDGYGQRHDELLLSVKKGDLDKDVNPVVGQAVQLKKPEGDSYFTGFVAEIDEETITIDANHPLAGKTLTFDVELVAIA